MDANGVGRRRLMSRETSPDRARVAERSQGRSVVRGHLPLGARRVQIVYYLSRNGQLEHPHFMELSQLPTQQLRLKDVIERLTLLRGKGMPSLYSWSCKRSYKNGYVWNDLSENDVIYPADGAEYVLKGSELIPGCSEQFQQLRLTNRVPKPLQARIQIEAESESDDEMAQAPKLTGINDTHISTRCSRGVNTDEILHVAKTRPVGPHHHHQTEITVDDGSPPSSSSSDPAVEAAGLARNSVFLNLIACGTGSVGGGFAKGRKSGVNPHKGVASRAARASRVGDEEEVKFMSENPRFGSLQCEDKEYFSGSVVLEAATRSINAGEEQPRLKKSSSYNEERSTTKVGLGEEECLRLRVEGEDRVGTVKGKCIPGRKKTSKK